ncbi:MarR family winged helix-turn-helix transcriptional regulator [Nocardioides currus]|uniref:MarR family transcriptional regulator n=1 Tax=Nocardioides currus TaxID=2133958 RepID=A0A2R7YXA6_9ACTN|nr:MarR family transcriptional regulator [Nocardioides currus]PUA81018.1 MarR family transcriptional regulator [Nocardioides currus]
MPQHTAETLRLSSDLVVHAARLVRAARRTSIQDGAGVRVLSLLDQLGPATVTALAAADRSSQPTMSGAVAALAEKGWVEKRPHPDDARASLVHVTPAGAAALSDVRRAHATAVADRLATTDHTTSDLATAVAVLRDLLAVDGATLAGSVEEGTL